MDEENYVLISWLSEYIYCKRRFYLRNLEQNDARNIFIEEGRISHSSVHIPVVEKRGDLFKVTGLHVYSHALNIYGICDNVEFTVAEGDKSSYIPFLNERCIAVPIEYKHGRTRSEIEYNAQLCAQAMCLNEMFHLQIDRGYIYYTDSRRRQEVVFDQDLFQTVKKSSAEIQNMLTSPKVPEPRNQKRCTKCSIYEICSPKQKMIDSYMQKIWSRYDNNK